MRKTEQRSSSALVPKHEQAAGPICGGSLAILAEMLGEKSPVEFKVMTTNGPQTLNQMRAREGMRKLYAKRRAAGLNAHGKPMAVPQRVNKRWNSDGVLLND